MRIQPSIVAIIAGFGMPLFASARTWTSTDGKIIEAEFVRVSGNTVIINRGGQTVTLPIERLSQADRDWVAAQAPDGTPASPSPAGGGDPKRIGKILMDGLKAEPTEGERKEVEAFIAALLPSKGADGEDVEWDVTFLPYGSPFPRKDLLITADMMPKGGTRKDRLMWFHIVFAEKKDAPKPAQNFGRYPAMRVKDAHLFVTAGRTDVRGVASADSYKSDEKIDTVMEAIDLRTISRL